MDFSLPALLVWYAVFLFSTTFHEFSHSVVAYLGGDRTAYEGGQVSLDPMPHIRREPVGLLIVPLVAFAMSGGRWMLGWASAPFDPRWAASHPRRYAGMSLAGPLANFVLALVAFVAIKVLVGMGVFEFSLSGLDRVVQAPGADAHRSAAGMLAMALSVMLSLNVVLGAFNLLPVPPLDGSAVVAGLWPSSAGVFMQKVRATPAFGFLGLVIAWVIFPRIAVPLLYFVYRALVAL